MAELTATTGELLQRCITEIGGDTRVGQQQMAAEVLATLLGRGHLMVQAGTGTGKSLGYLAPALAYLAADPDARIVIATATLALQRQLTVKDIPTVVAACKELLGKTISFAVLKGRSNYACLHRARMEIDENQAALFGIESVVSNKPNSSELGAAVVMLREWVQEQLSAGDLADRDDAPAHPGQAWGHVSVSARECLGQKCPAFSECLVEKSRDIAKRSQLIVTNHALLAINALHQGMALPTHDALIVDEAHELVARVTSAASAELSPQLVGRVARRALPYLSEETGSAFLECADTLEAALDEAEPGRVTDPDSAVAASFALVRDAARAAVRGIGTATEDVERFQAGAAVGEVLDIAANLAKLADSDVVWVSDREKFGRQACIAPLDVAGLMRGSIFDETNSVLTSATLKIGGDFASLAASLGMVDYRSIDVGSPFDYQTQGICYIAKDLPAPTKAGIQTPTLERIAELVWAAGGRTLGLFASQRSAEAAARFCRSEVPGSKILCQGDAQLSELTRQFIAYVDVCLFGTLSLWQGIDVPGQTCQLVIIDKIPFPPPDDPLQQARQLSVSKAGGNGFMQVAATHAGLLLAQGSGRLIRTLDDRGVVAVLDPRLVTARYGSFLRQSMPDFWTTTDLETAIAAIRRITGSATVAAD
ncbi:MAG: ATP-dependent DNA helicase [Propionibacteriaceae bacterium]|nr:ATP-dependent DNA helicase [Propionibacteriaceae bacterium]